MFFHETFATEFTSVHTLGHTKIPIEGKEIESEPERDYPFEDSSDIYSFKQGDGKCDGKDDERARDDRLCEICLA